MDIFPYFGTYNDVSFSLERSPDKLSVEPTDKWLGDYMQHGRAISLWQAVNFALQNLKVNQKTDEVQPLAGDFIYFHRIVFLQ